MIDIEKSWISFMSICQTFSSSSTITAVHLDVETLGYSSYRSIEKVVWCLQVAETNTNKQWPTVY